MGMSYEELLKMGQQFKERVWYFLECNQHKMTEAEIALLKDKVNDLLDNFDELPFEN